MMRILNRILGRILGPHRIERLGGCDTQRERIAVQSHAIAQRKQVEEGERERMYRDLAMLKSQLAIARRVEAERDHD